MLLVVCDATPLIYLAKIGRFELLHKLHEEVLVPPAVWQEVAIQGASFPEGTAIRQAATDGWLRVEKAKGRLPATVKEREELDSGEEEAIQLAIERSALLVIDESHGREIALRLKVKITGTVGLLIRSKLEGLVPSLQIELDRLRAETTFRLSLPVYNAALLAVGEFSA
jgi:predicted nucleic acid-binding protein